MAALFQAVGATPYRCVLAINGNDGLVGTLSYTDLHTAMAVGPLRTAFERAAATPAGLAVFNVDGTQSKHVRTRLVAGQDETKPTSGAYQIVWTANGLQATIAGGGKMLAEITLQPSKSR
jgi:hypothetical protein